MYAVIYLCKMDIVPLGSLKIERIDILNSDKLLGMKRSKIFIGGIAHRRSSSIAVGLGGLSLKLLVCNVVWILWAQAKKIMLFLA